MSATSKSGLTKTPIEEPLVPLDYQEHDIQQIVNAGGSALVVSSVGGRKTLVAVESALRIKAETILVIAPQGTHKRGWRRTILRQSNGADIRSLDSTPKGKEAFADLMWGVAGWYICTPQWFARQTWKDIKPDMAIFDEIHIAGEYENKTRLKLHQLDAGARLGLSGTPLRNKFENAWAIVRWIFPDHMKDNFYHWRRYSGVCEGKYDPFAPQNWLVTGEAEPGKLVNSLPCYIQHLARERCCQFHPRGFMDGLAAPIEIVRVVQMTPLQKKFYQQMEKNYVAWLGDNPVVATLPIVARIMLRFCALAVPSVDLETGKLYFEDDCQSPKITDLLTVLDSSEDSAVVYTHSQRFADIVVKRLHAHGITAFEWSGANTQKRRDAALELFIAGEIRVIVAVQKAVGTGTDGLQEATNLEITLSDDDDATVTEQTHGRLDRPGQKEAVVRIRIESEGTLDEGIYSRSMQKQLQMNAMTRKKAT